MTAQTRLVATYQRRTRRRICLPKDKKPLLLKRLPGDSQGAVMSPPVTSNIILDRITSNGIFSKSLWRSKTTFCWYFDSWSSFFANLFIHLIRVSSNWSRSNLCHLNFIDMKGSVLTGWPSASNKSLCSVGGMTNRSFAQDTFGSVTLLIELLIAREVSTKTTSLCGICTLLLLEATVFKDATEACSAALNDDNGFDLSRALSFPEDNLQLKVVSLARCFCLSR